MDEISANLKEFFNQPITVIIGSIIFFFIGVLIVISKTDLGKKLFKKVDAKIDSVITGTKSIQDSVEKKLCDIDNRANLLEAQVNETLAIYKERVLQIESLMLAVAENTHNEKIKEALNKYKELADGKMEDIETIVDEKFKSQIAEYKATFEEIKKELQEKYENGSNTLKNELKGHCEIKEGVEDGEKE